MGATPLPEKSETAAVTADSVYRQVQQILEDARQQARESIRDAAVQGREEGLRQGIAEIRTASERAAREKLARIQENGRQENERLTHECRRQEEQERARTAAMGLHSAAVIANMELHRDDSLFLGLVRAAALHIGKPEHLVLRVGPLGMTAARHYRMELEKLFGGSAKYEVSLSAHDDGACIIETPEGSVDSGVGTQLQRAAQLIGLPSAQPETLAAVPPADSGR